MCCCTVLSRVLISQSKAQCCKYFLSQVQLECKPLKYTTNKSTETVRTNLCLVEAYVVFNKAIKHCLLHSMPNAQGSFSQIEALVYQVYSLAVNLREDFQAVISIAWDYQLVLSFEVVSSFVLEIRVLEFPLYR